MRTCCILEHLPHIPALVGLSWLLIYRTDTYKVLKENIERLNKKLEKTKEKSASLSAKRAKDKKVAFYDEQLKVTDSSFSACFLSSSLLFLACSSSRATSPYRR